LPRNSFARNVRWLVALPFRAVGSLCVVAAFGFGLADVWLTVQRDEVVITNLGEIWYAVSPQTLNLAQAAIQRGIHPAIWDPGVRLFLMLPGLLGFLVIGTLILLVAQLIYRAR